MKRIFTIIIVLITISVVGIIALQLSWLENMILLRQDQIKEKVEKAVTIAGNELTQYKGSFSSPARSHSRLFDDNNFDFFDPLNQTIGRKFTVDELNGKIKKAFILAGLDKMKFEFAIEVISPPTIERQSGNYFQQLLDTMNNYSKGYVLSTPSGSETEGIAHNETLTVVVINWKSFAIQSLRWRFVTAILFSIIIITAFYLTVRTMLRQKKLGDIKNDFINNMTHEFKTPIATISLAVDAMRNEKVVSDREKLTYFNNIIKEENQRMNRQVETILKASQLERQEVDLALKPVHVHDIIRDVADNFILQLDERKGNVELALNATNDLVDADEVHFSNLVNNLIDNAIKYSKEGVPPIIKLTTNNNGKNFVMRIEDNGIGMNRETLKRVFERFYRAHTGNVHNVKGFGLGLSYVKTMVEAHHGDIKAESTLGKGSAFTMEIPLKKG